MERIGVIIQRLTEAVVLIDFGLLRNTKPVTRLCSVASCSRRDCLKLSSRISVITADNPSQRKHSSVVKRISLAFSTSMKIILFGAIPKDVNDGGNIFCDEEIQIMIPLFCLEEQRMPQTNAADEEKDSVVGQMNS